MNVLTSLDHAFKVDLSSTLNALYFPTIDFTSYNFNLCSCQIYWFYSLFLVTTMSSDGNILLEKFQHLFIQRVFCLFCFCYCLVKATSFEIRFGLESWICHLAIVQLWTTYFTFLSPIFSFIILKNLLIYNYCKD